MLANAIASAPITLRQDYRRIPPQEGRIARLLEYGPNPQMTTFQFIRCLEVMRDTTGAGYAFKEYDADGQVEALWPLKTEYVMPVIEQETRELYYQVRTEGVSYYIHSSCVIAVNHISTDGVTPVNPINVLQNSLDYDREVKEFSVNQMKNSLNAGYAVKIGNNYSDAEKAKLIQTLKAFKQEGVLILDGKKELQELNNTNFIDPRVFEVENITIARVARVFNIPVDRFLPKETSYSSAEQADLNYLKDTILPMARMYEQEFSRKLLGEAQRDAGMQIKLSLNGFARASMQARSAFYQIGMRSGWLCPDDVRGLEDLPPIPGGYGQQFFISKDLIPIQNAGKETTVNEQATS